MAYDEKLADRIRESISEIEGFTEKEMMGGLVFMLNEKMCLGIIKNELMCRIDPALHNEEVEKDGCRTMDFTKRPMKGYIMIDEFGLRNQKNVEHWIKLALDFNSKAKASKKK